MIEKYSEDYRSERKAYHDYDILEKVEAGVVLTGDEVKSLRAGHASLVGAFATAYKGELYLFNAHITPYDKAYIKDEDKAKASRKLLLHRRQIDKFIANIAKKGITIVPLKMYFNEKSKIKVELGIAKGKNVAAKKSHLRERDIERETRREIKGRIKH